MASNYDINWNEPLALFNAYLDGELSRGEREEFDARLREDAELREDYDEFVRVVEGVQNLPFEFAPDDFVEKVQGRIRSRSRGRFFGENFLNQARMPYEVVVVVIFIIMAAASLLMEMSYDPEVGEAWPQQSAPATTP